MSVQARLLLCSLLALTFAGCAVFDRIEIHRDPPGTGSYSCDFGSKFSEAACSLVTAQKGCGTYAYNPMSLGCTGSKCAGATTSCATDPILDHEHCTTLVEACDTGKVIAASALSTVESATKSLTAPAAVQLLASAPSIAEFSLPQAGMQPGPIIVAGNQLVFIATAACDASGGCPKGGFLTVDTAGTITRPFYIPCDGACVQTGLAPLPNGSGYCFGVTHQFYQGSREPDVINCVNNATHSVSEHALSVVNGVLAGLALGADGKIWYTDAQLNGIGRLDNATYALQASYLQPDTFLGLGAITSGPDGAMWFGAVNSNQIGRVTTSSLGLKTIPTADSQPAGITAGPDGNVWFAEFNGNKIGRITPAGVITEFALPTANAQPLGITTGPDGALWFTEFNANQIGRITRFGDISEYAIPTGNSQPAGIVTGPDGNIWFTELQGNNIGRLNVPPASTSPQVIEFYNTLLDTYFITAAAPEQTAIDSGSAGPGWSRTGSMFSAGGPTPVCRFYGSISPGPNSHFYTADAAECQALKDLQATTPSTQKRWNFESLDFNTTPAVNGSCPANLVPVYRAYNNGNVRGVDSNHRITSSPGAIAEVVKRGWTSEGIVMCAPL